MKRFLMLVAVAAVAGAIYVAAAPGSQEAAPGPTAKQFAALKRQEASLSKSLKALKKDEGKVKSAAGDAVGFIADCFVKAGFVPVSQFGDTSDTYGFVYQAAPSGAMTNRTALDLDASSTPQILLQSIDPSCVSTTGAASLAQIHSGNIHLLVRAEQAH